MGKLPINYQSPTGGVRPFPVEGPMAHEEYRLRGMTDLERAWRRQWLKDQVLAPNEPKPIPGYYQARYNPIKRFYRWPLDTLFMKLVPKLGYEKASTYRALTGGIAIAYVIGCCISYNLKYHQNDWTRLGGWRVSGPRPPVLPGDDRYPYAGEKIKSSDYYNEGFDKSPI